MKIKELIEELKKYDQDMEVSYPYFEEEGIIGGYMPLTDVGYEYGGESGEDIVRIMVL